MLGDSTAQGMPTTLDLTLIDRVVQVIRDAFASRPVDGPVGSAGRPFNFAHNGSTVHAVVTLIYCVPQGRYRVQLRAWLDAKSLAAHRNEVLALLLRQQLQSVSDFSVDRRYGVLEFVIGYNGD